MLVNFSFKPLNKTGLVVFLLIQSAALHAEEKTEVMNLPERPGSMPMAKEIIPPPPPGPYMSLALSDAKQHTFKPRLDEPANGFEAPDASLETFSPDVPWPDSVRETNPWMPENGYRYVQPPAMQNMRQAQPSYAPPAYNYGYGQPNMNNMGSPGAPTGYVPNAPYGNYPPGYGYPNYQQSYQQNYQQPANYNYYYGPTANPSSNTPGYPN